MKILKIALQNINSLKSNTPIVIDFQNNHFKDVGLYAITGVTGAGKTTILDAITIALYHNVPRFKNTKGTLLDVVSFGAHDAFCAVTFENNNIVYEGYWGIRLANKTGVSLKNPIEKVSLKNITTEKTIADQKRKYIEEVEKVTQLSYKQFLRSVMLAQGDFASFLTAKGPDKGKLLEQITGEGIYKAIGQHILERKSKEETNLKELESTINDDDIIKEEERTELTKLNNENKQQIATIEEALKEVKKIADWYQKDEKLTEEWNEIEKNNKSIIAFKEKHQKDLDLLALDEKATPFKELLQNITRLEKDIKEKNTRIHELTNELTQVNPVILTLQNNNKTLTQAFKKAETTIAEWQPKFDTILKIETDIKHQQEIITKNNVEITALEKTINTYTTQEKELTNKINQNTVSSKTLETYINQNKKLVEVDTQISNWTTDLITLKNNKKTLVDNQKFIKERENLITKSTADLNALTKVISKEEKELKELENNVISIIESLKNQKLSDLITKKDTLIKSESNWKTLKQYAENHKQLIQEKNALISSEKTILKDLNSNEKELLDIQKNILTQEQSVTDAKRILDLEKNIKNYETDRLKLIEGEACFLCGAVEHPYIKQGKEVNISKSENDLKTRLEALAFITKTKNELEKNMAIAKSKLASLQVQTTTNTTQLRNINTKSDALKLQCNISDIDTINKQLQSYTIELPKLETLLKQTQDLQLQKEKLSTVIKNKKEAITTFKIQIAQLTESIKHDKEEIDSKQILHKETTTICSQLEADLKSRLAIFNYQLPNTENTQQFITDIENSILEFNKKSKEFISLKNNEDKLHIELKNIKTNKESETKELHNLNKKLIRINKHITLEKVKRNSFLPENISITSKRNELQLEEKKLSNLLEENTKNIQVQLKLKAEKEILKEQNKTALLKLNTELNSHNNRFNEQLKNSDFDTKESLEEAVLQEDQKAIITKNKERIRENIIKINTIKEAFKKNSENLLKQKNFSITKIENKQRLNDLLLKQKEITTNIGAIQERFRKDKEIRNRNKDIYLKIEKQSKICDTWKQLYFLIGSSKDALNVYVQRITLQNLLKLANIHLYNLNKRYSLKLESSYKKGEELNFKLIDHYQTNQSRLVDTCSGGEKFIISLALALGLSDLASKNVKIDSLFIDEGFGTLDNNSLETVINTLETLQSQGKVIGIISHVENLKERIPTQIKISKKSNGVSTIAIV